MATTQRTLPRPAWLALVTLMTPPLVAGNLPSRAVKGGIVLAVLAGKAAGVVPSEVDRGLLGKALEAYPSRECPGAGDRTFQEAAKHCAPGSARPSRPSADESVSLALRIGNGAMAEEYVASAHAGVQDLEDCVCLALAGFVRSSAEDRVEVLYTRLQETDVMAKDLLVGGVGEAQGVQKAGWAYLKVHPEGWNEPDSWATAASDEDIRWAERPDMAGDVAETIQVAVRKHLEVIRPLLKHLKAEVKARAKQAAKTTQAAVSTPATILDHGPPARDADEGIGR